MCVHKVLKTILNKHSMFSQEKKNLNDCHNPDEIPNLWITLTTDELLCLKNYYRLDLNDVMVDPRRPPGFENSTTFHPHFYINTIDH